MKDLFIRPNIDKSSVNISFTLPQDCEKCSYQIFDIDTNLISQGLFETSNKQIVFDVYIADSKLWSVDNPYLYKLVLKLDDTEKQQTFGMTKIDVNDKIIYFNNSPLYIRGHIRGREAHDHPNFLNCSDKEYYEKNIKATKAYGFNFIRFHSRVPEDAFLEAADRLGILCQVEIRPYYGKYQKERQSTGFDGDQVLVNEKDWGEMILRLRNHPCVLVYCMGNEINSPGKNERVNIISKLTKKLDNTRLFLDTCSRGEYDRDTVDFDVQHMSYFAPFGKNYDMFNDSIHLSLYGSVKGKEMEVNSQTSLTRREISIDKPLLAHEICHYNLLRDPYRLKEKFAEYQQDLPWWIDELIKMIEIKGYKDQFDIMLKASTHFYYIWLKQCIESVRKSPILQGFHFLQLSDTDRYENANGLLDCFDDPKDIAAEEVMKFNGSCVLLADLPRRSFWENEKVSIPIKLSNYDPAIKGSATFKWQLIDKKTNKILMSSGMNGFELGGDGLVDICRIELTLPKSSSPLDMQLCGKIAGISNSWDLWLFPNKTQLKTKIANIKVNTLNFSIRYPQLKKDPQSKLLIANKFDDEVFANLDNGNDVLMLYRVDETRDRTANQEKYYLPSTWDRFKGIIWDRGHNCGGFLRDHPLTNSFPCDEYIDWQFYNLINDCDKISLDDFPVKVEPIVEGIDKAVRDRYDVGRFDLPEFQYNWTMRKFAYAFELKVGNGRLFITGFNFKGIENNTPETCYMFESIINYIASDCFSPIANISVSDFKTYLNDKGNLPRIKERMMTQYWQFDDAPLESKQYWKDSEQWLRVGIDQRQ